MSEDPGLRASDRQRDVLAAELRDHFAAGRLTEEELNERIDATYRSRTHGELAQLRADLPALPATRAQTRAELAERRAQLRGEMLQQVGGGLVPFLVCTAIWVAAGASGAFWPVWVALFALIPLLRNGWRLYGPSPDLDTVEADLARRREHDRRHGHHRHPHRHR